MPKVFSKRILDNPANISPQAPEILNGLWSQDDLMTHSGQNTARLWPQVKMSSSRVANDQGQPAATDPAREILCLACAGSGKSRTLAYRIARLIADGEPPSGIVAFTFTEKAAESIKQQVAKALLAGGLDPMVLGAQRERNRPGIRDFACGRLHQEPASGSEI